MVPGLAQAALSKDLKALQDLINAEKVVQQTYALYQYCVRLCVALTRRRQPPQARPGHREGVGGG